MANTTKDTQKTLAGRVAAIKQPNTKVSSEMKKRVAAAWTLAKTMLPTAPYAEQVKCAQVQLGNTTQALTAMLRQTAINAHYTRVGSKIEEVHKMDLNDLLEDPSILTKEQKGVEGELKGDPKSAASKKADDRKESGPLPDAYPEPKRSEPKELDGDRAADRPDLEKLEKEAAAKKKAHGKDCKGCPNCDKEKKAAARKKADDAAAEDEATASEDAASEDASASDETPASEDAPAEDAVPDDVDADLSDEGESSEDEPEPFDEEKTDLEDAADDLQADIDKLQDAVAEFQADPSDISFDGEEDGLSEDGLDDFDPMAEEAPEGQEDALAEEGEGEELDLNDIFAPDAMADKVSALNDEDILDMEEQDGEDFFAPSDPSELESVLEQEEGLSSPADMFKMDGADDDPLSRIFASKKHAGEEGVLEPGKLDDHFGTDLKGDERDADSDHDDIFAEVYDKLDQPTRDDQRDTEPDLKEPSSAKEAGKKASTIRRIRQGASNKEASGSLSTLIFPDESDYL